VDRVQARVVHNKGGLVDWDLGEGRTLFGSMPPSMLYRDWAPLEKEKAHASATFIVGSNVGYGLNHVLSNTPNAHKVYLLEPDPETLLGCLSQTDYTPFFEIGKLTILPPDKEQVRRAVQRCDLQYLFGRIHLRLDLPSQQVSGQYAHWGRLLREQLEGLTVELSTLRRRQDLMVGNELSNFERALADGGLKNMQGAGRGLSAVVLGAGPSLMQFGPELARNRGYALYATALQTMPALQDMGLVPHLCMAIDFNEGMTAVYRRLDPEFARRVPLLYSTKIDPRVLARYPGPTIPFWTLGGVASFVMQEREYVLDAGGNVSVALTRFLEYCGVRDILLVGQDFAWKGERTHAQGHHSDRQTFKPEPGRYMELKDRDGGTLYSSLPYVSALRDMERDITTASARYHNLYGGGAVIRGARMVDLHQAVMDGLLGSTPGSLETFLDRLDEARRPRTWPRFEPRAAQWATSLRSVRKRLEKLFKKPARHQADIHASLSQVHAFISQDPLYTPYLYNEIMDAAGLARARLHYGLPELTEFRQLVKRVLGKVRRVDEVLAPPTPNRAA
jgi:hypothetical protein